MDLKPLFVHTDLSLGESEDKIILNALGIGDEKALRQLMNKYYPTLYRYGSKFSNDKGIVADSIQDIFLFLWERRSNSNTIKSLRPYLFSALRNNLIRRLKYEIRLTDLASSDSKFLDYGFAEELIMEDEADQQKKRNLENGINQLPLRQREALYLRYYEDLSYDEIADVMGLKRQAVANYLQLALEKMRNCWRYAVIFFVFLSI